MKKVLLLPILILSYVASFSQQKEKKTIHVSTNKHMRKFLDSKSQQKPAILLEPLTVKEYPQQITLSDSLRNGYIRKENQFVFTHTIPVLSPDSNYVFNMPGTFAFDKNQARVHTPRFVTVVNVKKASTSEKGNSSNKK